MKRIENNTFPYLQLLSVKTKLSESSLVNEQVARAMKGAQTGSSEQFESFCIRLSGADSRFLFCEKNLWGDLDSSWPRFAEKYASRVDIVDEPFLLAVHDFIKSFAENDIEPGDYVANRSFCGTIAILPIGTTVSYSLSFDNVGDFKEDCSLLMLDKTGKILAYESADVKYAHQKVVSIATSHLRYVMPPLDTMMGAFQMKNLVRRYLQYGHFVGVKTERVDSDFPFDCWLVSKG